MNEKQHLVTQPVIKWAQSQSQIFLNLRLSHRHDSPTCSDIRKQLIGSDVSDVDGDFDIYKVQSKQVEEGKENSRLKFESQCFFTHQKLLFSIDLTFKATLSKLVVKKEGFGRYTVVGTKDINEIWINPFSSIKDAGIWSEMRNKYETDMDKYFQLLESATENTPAKAKKKFRSKKAQMKYQTGQL